MFRNILRKSIASVSTAALLLSMIIVPGMGVNTAQAAWYDAYNATADALGVLEGIDMSNPGAPMNRGEFFKLMVNYGLVTEYIYTSDLIYDAENNIDYAATLVELGMVQGEGGDINNLNLKGELTKAAGAKLAAIGTWLSSQDEEGQDFPGLVGMFTDFNSSNTNVWYAPYFYALGLDQAITGEGDGSSGAGNTLNKVTANKMAGATLGAFAEADGEQLVFTTLSDVLAGTGGGGTTGGDLMVSLASDTPEGTAIPAGATPATNVEFARINFKAGSNAVNVSRITVARTNLSSDNIIASLKLFIGQQQLDNGQVLNSAHQARFNVNITIPANSTVVVRVVSDLCNNVTCPTNSGSLVQLGIASNSDIVSDASSVTGAPVFGNTFSATNTSVGSLTIGQSSQMPAAGSTANIDERKVVFGAAMTAGSVEDVYIDSMIFESGDNSTIDRGDVMTIELWNDTDGILIATLDALNSDGDAVFDLSENPELLPKGTTRQYVVKVDIVNGTTRAIAFDINDGTSYLLSTRGGLYGYGVSLLNGGGWTGATGVGTAITVNAGTLTVSKSITSPSAGNIPRGGTDITVGIWEFKAKGEEIRIGTTVVQLIVTDSAGNLFTAGACTTVLDNVKLIDADTGAVLAGPVSPTGTVVVGPGANTCTATFASYEIKNGANRILISINTTSTMPANVTVLAQVVGAGFANVRGITSNRAITPTPAAANIPANLQTVQAASLVGSVASVPVAQNVVAGKVAYRVGYINLSATASGENVRVATLSLTNTGTALTTEWVNARLINVGTGEQVGDTIQPTANVAAFTFSGDQLVIPKGTEINIAPEITILSTTTPGNTFIYGITTLTGTGKASSTAAAVTIVAGTSPVQTVVASGSLRVAPDADTATAAQLVSDSTGNSVVSIKFTAVDEDIDVRDMQIVGAVENTATAVAANWANNVMSMDFYLDGQKIGGTITTSANGIQLVSFQAGTIVVKKNESVVFTIKVNMHNKTNLVTSAAAAGSFFRVGIANDTGVGTYGDGTGFGTTWNGMAGAAADGYGISAFGMESGAQLAAATINSTGAAGGLIYGGNIFSAHDAILLLTVHDQSPGGVKSSSPTQEIAKINLAAVGDDVNINMIGTQISATCTFTSPTAAEQKLMSSDRTIVYDPAGSAALGTGTTEIEFAPTTPLVIAKNTTKVVIITGDTVGCTPGTDTLAVAISATTNTAYGVNHQSVDGVAVGAAAWVGPSGKGTPWNFPTITY